MAPIAWQPWRSEAFARARAEARPVLLSIAPSWCPHSARMHRTSFTDPRVVALVADRFVPVRVDPDRRPDIGERYSLGGWPTTAFLTPDGEILGGGTYLDVDPLAGVLQRVHDAFASGRHIGARTARDAAAPSGPAPSTEDLIDLVTGAFDEEHGAFGPAPRFPHAAPIHLCLHLYRTRGDEGFRHMAVRALDAMGWGPLHDEADGGFFRCAHDADWGRPDAGKLLEVNASLLALYLEAFDTLQLARYGERAEDILRYVQTWLADTVDGGWYASRAPAREQDPARGAGGDGRPAVDGTMYADWNGSMASAALRAARALDDSGLAAFALQSLERVVLAGYRPGAGVAHCVAAGEAPVRGLLGDQIAMAAAHLDAYEATGNVVYEMMAQELALYAVRTMWDAVDGGFVDRAPDPRRDIGLLRVPVKPLGLNCAAVRMLRRLARASGSAEYAGQADAAIAAMARRAPLEGPALAADYVLAAEATG